MKLLIIESKVWKFSKVGPITISFHMLNHEPLKGSEGEEDGGDGWPIMLLWSTKLFLSCFDFKEKRAP